MCFKKPKFDSVQKIEEELEEGGGTIFEGGLGVEEDGYDDIMWGQTGTALDVTEMVWSGTIQATWPSLGVFNVEPAWQQSQSILSLLPSQTIFQSALQTVMQGMVQMITHVEEQEQEEESEDHDSIFGNIFEGWEEEDIFGDTLTGEVEVAREVTKEDQDNIFGNIFEGWEEEDIFGDTQTGEVEVAREVNDEALLMVEVAKEEVEEWAAVDSEEEESDASQLSMEEEDGLWKDPPSLTDSEEEGSNASSTMS